MKEERRLLGEPLSLRLEQTFSSVSSPPSVNGGLLQRPINLCRLSISLRLSVSALFYPDFLGIDLVGV
jgi:hypothetical protein